MAVMTAAEFLIFLLGGEQRLHTRHLKLHFDTAGQLIDHVLHGECHVLFEIHGRTDGGKQMGIVQFNGMFLIQLQCTDKCLFQLGEEMKRSSQKGHMAADRLTAGQTADGLVDHCLENGRRQILLGRTVVDQGLNIRLGKYAAAGRDGIKRLVILRVFVQSGRIGLQKRSHLIDEGAGSSGTDAVHPLLHISIFKIDDLRILTAELDRHIRFRRQLLQGGGYGNHLLHEGYAQMVRKGQTAGTCDHGMQGQISKLLQALLKKLGQGFLYICKMPFIIGKKDVMRFIQDGDLYRGGTDVDSKTVSFSAFGKGRVCITHIAIFFLSSY